MLQLDEFHVWLLNSLLKIYYYNCVFWIGQVRLRQVFLGYFILFQVILGNFRLEICQVVTSEVLPLYHIKLINYSIVFHLSQKSFLKLNVTDKNCSYYLNKILQLTHCSRNVENPTMNANCRSSKNSCNIIQTKPCC